MRRIAIILILLSIILILSSCAPGVPNPIVGTYSLRAEDSQTHDASVVLKKDGTFVFVQIIPETSRTLKIEGRYEYVLRAYNFTSADGSIYFSVKEGSIPDEISNSFLSEGTNSFQYGWKCDKNNGVESLTLTTDPNNSAEIYIFSYSGSETALDGYESSY